MKNSISIRNRFLGIFAALLILLQSLVAMGVPAPYAEAEQHTNKQTEVKQEVSSKASFVEVTTRVTLATFLFYWIAKTFTLLDVPVIRYQNCTAFFVNPTTFNSYYTHLSALAP
ncbi:hypothetical protein [Catalinimonas niigatensis]|uniref:hypothetical protein n=1 Tax=Catalinimonas niigatensis TaxID=1397264 RepID=UPI002665CFB0|nr:hypothetical protein [Catalinimonas niigatensis]WPP51929.1 hypothetical protein PZB72_05955 [Catalinimonas niigatensis]